jgi:hypothetical protein
MPTYRYVLNLIGGDGVRVVRHTSSKPVAEGDLITLAELGSWEITRVVQAGEGTGDGIVDARRVGRQELQAR